MIKKFTDGWVEQTFDDEGNLLEQKFVTSDIADYEDVNGKLLDVNDKRRIFYHPFDMVQPEKE